jgi:ABC-type phosphate transport system substrate-binding protein
MKIFKSIFVMMLSVMALLPVPLNAESPDDLVVFVNKKSRVRDLSVEELKQIFLKKKTRWPGGDKINCINSPEGSAEREAFRKRVLGMSKTEEITYWQNQKIRMQLSPPIEVSNTAKAVFRLNGAIGYAFRKDLPEGVVKAVLVLP